MAATVEKRRVGIRQELWLLVSLEVLLQELVPITCTASTEVHSAARAGIAATGVQDLASTLEVTRSADHKERGTRSKMT